MSNYLIKLTPVGKFFFGSDMTFSVGTKDLPKEWYKRPSEERTRIEDQVRFNTRYASYIIKSEKFPQQTSLLGMLRFFMLRNEKDLFENDHIKKGDAVREKVEELIGRHSFEANGDGNYGCIKELSPCFLMKDNQIVTRMPMDYGLVEVKLINNDVNKPEDKNEPNGEFYNSKPIDLSTIKIRNGEKIIDFNAKDGDLSEKYGFCIDGKKIVILDADEIFIEDQRIGINRDIVTGHTEDNALFKQVNYRLADGFCFAFYAQIDKDITTTFNDSNLISPLVSLGADNSQFVINIVQIDREDDNLPAVSLPVVDAKLDDGFKKVVLTSPALIDNVTSCFHIASTIPFKHMKTTIDLPSYHRLSGIKHSDRVELYQTGSVFYFKSENDAANFAKEIEKREDYYQIGYNHCQVI